MQKDCSSSQTRSIHRKLGRLISLPANRRTKSVFVLSTSQSTRHNLAQHLRVQLISFVVLWAANDEHNLNTKLFVYISFKSISIVIFPFSPFYCYNVALHRISFYFIVVIIVYLYYYHCIFLLLFSLLLLFITYFRVVFCYNDFVAISRLQLLYPYCYPCYNGNNIVVINFFSVLFLIDSFYGFYLSSISFNLYSFLKDFCQFAILKKAAKPQTKWLLISKKPNERLFECKFASHINCCSYTLIEFV